MTRLEKEALMAQVKIAEALKEITKTLEMILNELENMNQTLKNQIMKTYLKDLKENWLTYVILCIMIAMIIYMIKLADIYLQLKDIT